MTPEQKEALKEAFLSGKMSDDQKLEAIRLLTIDKIEMEKAAKAKDRDTLAQLIQLENESGGLPPALAEQKKKLMKGRAEPAREQRPDSAVSTSADFLQGLKGAVETVTVPAAGSLLEFAGLKGAKGTAKRLSAQTRAETAAASKRSPIATGAGQVSAAIAPAALGLAALGASGVPGAIAGAGKAAAKVAGSGLTRNSLLAALLAKVL